MALLEYECPACGGKLEYNSNTEKMKCPYCDTEIEVAALKELDDELSTEGTENLSWNEDGQEYWNDLPEGSAAYECKSCGAQIITEATTAASTCPFCDNPIVMMGNLKGALKPDLIVPFKLDKKAAKVKYNSHLQNKKLLPHVFKEQNHIDEIRGVYVPFWIYDSKADADICFTATRTRFYRSGKYDCHETSYYKVLRAGNLAFENITVDGSRKMEDDLMDSLEPFDLKSAVDFQTAYLSGYLADKYDVSAQECSERANERVRNSTAAVFEGTVTGYSSVTTDHSSIRLQNGRVRYGLLPVWILNTTWKGEKYTFAMNGQTGKFVGNLPCDKSLFRKMWLKTGAVTAAIVFAAAYLINIL